MSTTVICTGCNGFGARSGNKCQACEGKGIVENKPPPVHRSRTPARAATRAATHLPAAIAPTIPQSSSVQIDPPSSSSPVPAYAEDPRLHPVSVTIVVLSHNNVDGALRTIRSALNHAHKNIEVLLIDDGSSDDTPQVAAAIHDSRFLVIRRPWKSGRDAALKLGVVQSSGEFVLILDAGDIINPKDIDSALEESRSGKIAACDPVCAENGKLYKKASS